MIPIALFILAVVLAFLQKRNFLEALLSYILLLVVGVMGFLAAYAHVFMGPETAKSIGWESGSPFQYEMGMANLSYGVLGILAYWLRGRFWDATIIGWSVLFLGCFVGHVIDYYETGNTAPYNIGFPIIFYGFFMPTLTLILLGIHRVRR